MLETWCENRMMFERLFAKKARLLAVATTTIKEAIGTRNDFLQIKCVGDQQHTTLHQTNEKEGKPTLQTRRKTPSAIWHQSPKTKNGWSNEKLQRQQNSLMQKLRPREVTLWAATCWGCGLRVILNAFAQTERVSGQLPQPTTIWETNVDRNNSGFLPAAHGQTNASSLKAWRGVRGDCVIKAWAIGCNRDWAKPHRQQFQEGKLKWKINTFARTADTHKGNIDEQFELNREIVLK